MAMHANPQMISSGHGLLEAPLNEGDGSMLFTDASNGGVIRRTPDGHFETVIAHRKGIGGLARHADGGWVVSGRNVALKTSAADGSATHVLAEQDVDRGIVGYNDLVTDRAGRIYVGSLAFVPIKDEDPQGREGSLHVIDLDGTCRTVWGGIKLTNGLGFSPDGSILYHSDSLAHVVYRYRVTGDGDVEDREVFARVEEGIPDGMAVAADGSVFVAVAHGSMIRRFSPDGVEVDRIEFPVPMVTNLCFSGEELDQLFVTTGLAGAPPELGGCLFTVDVDVPGLPVPPARVRPPVG